jgi:hypothetical protein
MASQLGIEQTADDSTVSYDVITSVAAERGVDPLTLEPLSEVVDPDALDAIYGRNGIASPGTPLRVEFTYAGCDVVLDADGTVTVSQREQIDDVRNHP